MEDGFKRQIEYMRISITDRCNLRCSYCMPPEGVRWLPSSDVLSYEEILRFVNLSTELGFKKFRVTGGEPLVRKGVIPFLQKLASNPGVEDLTLTTNGILLGEMAQELKNVGVRRVNISLDTLDSKKFSEITRGGDLQDVLAGINKSLEVGLHPVKVNVVVIRGFNDDELEAFFHMAEQQPLHIRFIELMPVGASDGNKNLVPVEEMKDRLGLSNLVPVKEFQGAGPAQHYAGVGMKGSIGFISALSQHFCSECNRIRLTADGRLRPCLHSTKELDLRALLRNGASDLELKELLAEAILLKPGQHHMNTEGWQGRDRGMSQIGG
jgi:GTP 3',8-cyclase